MSPSSATRIRSRSHLPPPSMPSDNNAVFVHDNRGSWYSKCAFLWSCVPMRSGSPRAVGLSKSSWFLSLPRYHNVPKSHEISRRQNPVPRRAPPQMQTVRMHVHVYRSRRMKLRYAILRVPEDVLDLAHLFPGRCRVWSRDRNMFPALTIGGYDENATRVPQPDLECTIVHVALVRCHRAYDNAKFLRYVETHSSGSCFVISTSPLPSRYCQTRSPSR